MNLILALQKLNESLKLEVLEFWGKIEGYKFFEKYKFEGIDDDYYIARGLSYKGEQGFPQKSFFWAYY